MGAASRVQQNRSNAVKKTPVHARNPRESGRSGCRHAGVWWCCSLRSTGNFERAPSPCPGGCAAEPCKRSVGYSATPRRLIAAARPQTDRSTIAAAGSGRLAAAQQRRLTRSVRCLSQWPGLNERRAAHQHRTRSPGRNAHRRNACSPVTLWRRASCRLRRDSHGGSSDRRVVLTERSEVGSESRRSRRSLSHGPPPTPRTSPPFVAPAAAISLGRSGLGARGRSASQPGADPTPVPLRSGRRVKRKAPPRERVHEPPRAAEAPKWYNGRPNERAEPADAHGTSC